MAEIGRISKRSNLPNETETGVAIFPGGPWDRGRGQINRDLLGKGL
jgi:hypothetical protein